MKLSGLIPPMVTPLDAKRRLDKKGTKKTFAFDKGKGLFEK